MNRRSFLVGGGVVGLTACAKPQRDLLAARNINAINLRPAASTSTTTESPYPVFVPDEDLPGVSFVASAVGPTTNISLEPGGPTNRSFSNPIESGGPLVFLLDSFLDDSDYRVLLPVRPNGTFGWVSAADVSLTRHNYRLLIELDEFRLTLFDNEDSAFVTEIGVARENTPTPHGIYYTTELIRPVAPNSVYGSFAYGLSGYSDTLTEFAGGPGQLGIHGTNDPSTIGTDVSHGCIHMRNADISMLVEEIGLPVGVPVEVV